jgi:hypothetical protein
MLITITLLIAVLVNAALGSLILWPLAKVLTKSEYATYVRTFFVSTSAGISFLLLYGLAVIVAFDQPQAILKIGTGGAFAIFFAFLFTPYVAFGRLFWKTTYLRSLIANLPWFIAVLAIYFASYKLIIG